MEFGLDGVLEPAVQEEFAAAPGNCQSPARRTHRHLICRRFDGPEKGLRIELPDLPRGRGAAEIKNDLYITPFRLPHPLHFARAQVPSEILQEGVLLRRRRSGFALFFRFSFGDSTSHSSHGCSGGCADSTFHVISRSFNSERTCCSGWFSAQSVSFARTSSSAGNNCWSIKADLIA